MRQHERERLDDVRRVLEQRLALVQRLRHQAEFVVFEVPQAAVDQLGAPGRRVRGEIVLFRQQHRHAAARGVPRDARAIDPPADDEQIVDRGSGGRHGNRGKPRL